MGKIIELNDAVSHTKAMQKIALNSAKEKSKEEKRENKRKASLHKLDVRDRDRKHIIKVVSFIFLLVMGILKYTNNIPIPTEIIVGIPASAILHVDPKNIFDVFKKPPP